MPSQLKSDTARANGAKSRGPKTAVGLEKSSQNAVKHGFTMRNMVLLECEDPDAFKEFAGEYAATYKPASDAEQNLVDEMIAARWRMQRIWMVETALMDDAMSRPSTENQPASDDPGIQLAQAFRFLADDTRALSLLSRYESRFHRIYHRAYQTLRELQQAPKLQATEAVQPEPPPPASPDALKEGFLRPAGKVEDTNPTFPSHTLSLCAPSTKKLRNEPSNSRTLRRLRNHKVIHLVKRSQYGQAKVA